MRRREAEVFEAIRAAHRFIGTHAEHLGSVSEAGMYRALGDTLERIQTYAVEQSAGTFASKGATIGHRIARKALLVDHMTPIARISNLLSRSNPEMKELKLPDSYLPAEAFAAVARAMAREASKWKDDFVEMGLPTDFVERMNAAADLVVSTSTERRVRLVDRSGATHGIRLELSKARKLLQVMDAFVTSAVHADPALLAQWQSVKRLPRARKREAALVVAPAAAPLMLASGDAQPIFATARIAVEGFTQRMLRRLLPGKQE